MYMRFVFWMTLLTIVCSSCAKDKPVDPGPETPRDTVELSDKILTDHLEFPWEIVWGNDNSIWMTERPGRISRVDPSSGAVTPVFTIPDIATQGEGGLLGMALHPEFTTTPQVFVAYTYNKSNQFTEKIVRFDFDGTTLKNPLVLLDDIVAASIHNGSRLVIGSDHTLYISTGDASDQTNPQNVEKLNGKILRINLDGTIPADNPQNTSPVWTIGHRNPQGLVFITNRLYSSEHGPDTDDEINIIQRSGNYGWPDVHGFCEGSEVNFCDKNDVLEPIKAWTPTIAPSGIDYYNSDLIPQLKNSLLVAVLKDQRLLQLKLSDDGNSIDSETAFFVAKYGRMRDVCVSPEGKIYVCTSNGDDDKIIEITASAN